MLYNINGCLKEMTEQEKKALDWSTDALNPINAPELETTEEKEIKRQSWLDIKVRPERNKMLVDSDIWTLKPAIVSKTTEQVNIYQQSLRDFPETITEIPADGIAPSLPIL